MSEKATILVQLTTEYIAKDPYSEALAADTGANVCVNDVDSGIARLVCRPEDVTSIRTKVAARGLSVIEK